MRGRHWPTIVLLVVALVVFMAVAHWRDTTRPLSPIAPALTIRPAQGR